MTKFLRLSIDDQLDKPILKNWYKIVKNNLHPSDVQRIDIDHRLVKMIHKKMKNGQHYYDIPINPDIDIETIDKVVRKFDSENPDLQYEIMIVDDELGDDKDELNDLDSFDPQVSEEDYDLLALELAKAHHADWMRKKQKLGWTYGLKFNSKEKISPLIMPWEQLPSKYKIIDYVLPEKMLSVLENLGYVVIKEEDLNNLMNMTDEYSNTSSYHTLDYEYDPDK